MLRRWLCAVTLAIAACAVSAAVASADADLGLTLTGSRSLTAGQDSTFTAAVVNDGPNAAPNVRVTVRFSSLMEVRAAPGCTIRGTEVGCTPGALQPGASASAKITARPKSGGVMLVQAVAESDEPDPNSGNNSGGFRARVRGSSSTGGGRGGTTTSTPVAGKTEVVSVVSGRPLVKLPGSRRFVAVTSAKAIPDGSEIDTSKGTLHITVAVPGGGTESAELSEGRAILHQDLTRTPAVTQLTLSEPLKGCPAGARAAKKRPPGAKSRRIVISTKGGHFESVGRYATAIAAGTAWRTTDLCGSTVIKVIEGTVQITDRRTGRAAPLTAPNKRTVKRRKKG